MEYLLTIMLLGNGNNTITTIILPNKEICVRALQTNIDAVPTVKVIGTCVQIRK